MDGIWLLFLAIKETVLAGEGSSPHPSVRGRVKVQTAQRDGSKLMIVFNLRSPQRFMTLYDPPLEVTLLRDL